ncbi:hypothetical protein N9Z72_00360 [Akkermansiaceae bacterium]|nr:hypothetical protein [Akkermansiaceae bacterium]|tara:strand:+ start:401 stop:1033 length:633 start_codon:yes stop_codon:yes gene_type:complete
MATLALNVGYFIQGDVGSSAQNAQGQASGTPNQTGGDQPAAMQYFQSSGRGGGTFRYTRTFLNFNTSGISTLSPTGNVKLNVQGITNFDTQVFAVKSTHSTPILASGDDFNNINVDQQYSGETDWSTSINEIILNSFAISDINNQDSFNVALIIKSDLLNTETPLEEDGDLSCGVNFSDIELEYTLPVLIVPSIKLTSGKVKITSGKIKI